MNATAKKETAQTMVVAPETATIPDMSAMMTLVQRAALDPSFDVSKLQALMEMKERWDANEARKAFVSAMAEFKANPPEILKRKLVEFDTTKGKTTYMHAELADVTAAVIQPLAQAGFSHAWATKQLDGGMIEVSCTLTHRLGHCETVMLKNASDQSGGKNNIQALASTVTYLERYTLLMATGLATKGMDDDGRGAFGEPAIDAKDADWIALLDGLTATATADDLRARKAELLTSYGGADMIPKAIFVAYNAALKRAKEGVK